MSQVHEKAIPCGRPQILAPRTQEHNSRSRNAHEGRANGGRSQKLSIGQITRMGGGTAAANGITSDLL